MASSRRTFPKDEASAVKLLTGATRSTMDEVVLTFVEMLGHPQGVDTAARALRAFDGAVDARLYTAMADVFRLVPDRSGETLAFFEKHHTEPRTHEVLRQCLEGFVAREELPADGYAYYIFNSQFDEVVFPGTAPALAKLAAIAAKKPKWEFESIINALDRLADASTLPALISIRDSLKAGGAKKAVSSVIASITKKSGGKVPAGPAETSSDPLEQRILQAGLTLERAREIRALARTGVLVETKKSKEAALGCSRFGGQPDLPAGTAWPTVPVSARVYEPDDDEDIPLEQGKYQVPLWFLAQVNLADVHAHDADGLLPKSGMLWFFASAESVVGAWQDLEKLACRVLYDPKPKGLAPLTPPKNLAKRYQFKSAVASFSRQRPLPPAHVEPFAKVGLTQAEGKAYEQAVAQDKCHAESHAMLGWAEAGYFRGIPSKKEQLLLAVRSDITSGFTFGDDTSIYFCIPTVALAARDFGKAFCVFDE